MNKLIILLPIFLLSMCSDAPVTPPAQACSPPLDGSDFTCPPWDFELDDSKPKPLIPKQELKGEVDIYNPDHWVQMQMMFQRNLRKGQIERNARRTEIEKNMTTPSDAINSALDDFMEAQYGSDGSTEQEKLL